MSIVAEAKMVNTRPKRLYSIKNIPSYRCFPLAMCTFPIMHLVCPMTKVLSTVGQPGLRMLQRIKCLNKQYVKLVALLLLQNTVNEANFVFVVD